MPFMFLFLMALESLFLISCDAFVAVSTHVKLQNMKDVSIHSYLINPRYLGMQVTKLSAAIRMDRVSLEKLTVKELKDKIKEMNTDVKLSQLKLKSDLINFLMQKNDDPMEHDQNDETNSLNKAQAKTKRPRSMPPLQMSNNPTSSDKDAMTSATSNLVSPKDLIFEKVYNRYPPLRYLQTALDDQDVDGDNSLIHHMNPSLSKSFSALGENDIRQKYHPIMQGLTSSDLDIVTVGTASCVPGVTRGVSCTALRLQWRRRGEEGQPNNEPVTAGIWIFDCGESTQVRYLELYIRTNMLIMRRL